MSERTEGSVASPGAGLPRGPEHRPRNRSSRQIEESAEIKAGIVRTAMRMFAERGYAQTSLADIGQVVGLSRPGLLYHFESKEALFRAVLDALRGWADNQVAGPAEFPDLDRLRELGAFIGAAQEARVPVRLVHVLAGESIVGNDIARDFTVTRVERVHTDIADRLRSLRERGEIDPEVSIDAAATLIFAVINALQTRVLLDLPVDSAAFELLIDLLRPRHPESGSTEPGRSARA